MEREKTTRARKAAMMVTVLLMVGALLAGAVQTLSAQPSTSGSRAALENVRDYAPAADAEAPGYAVDGGVLFGGSDGQWKEIETPKGVIVGAVAIDSLRPDSIYIGAANELTVFRSEDGGETWLRVPLSDTPGGVTDIAVDGMQRLVYAGTDTDGVFRLRDVGSSMIVGGQLLLDEPVRQVASDSTGAALAFARTDTHLYRAQNYGLTWSIVDNLHSSPTAIAIADTNPATIFVGTTDRGLLASGDGLTWSPANEGLEYSPGTRLHVDALAVDPRRPEQLTVATSYLYGSTTLHQTHSRVAMSSDGGESWGGLDREFATTVSDLLPASGSPGAVYALTSESRAPLALFDRPALAVDTAVDAAGAGTRIAPARAAQNPFAWIVAALAALALGVFVTYDVRGRGVHHAPQSIPLTALDTQTLPIVG